MRTRVRGRYALLALALFAAIPAAWACGFCVEDRVAAVYDQAQVDSALAQRRRVAFFGLEGTPRIDAATRRSVLAALSGAGTVSGSARVDLDAAAGAVAYDPRRTDPRALAAAAQRKLAALGIRVVALRTVDAEGTLIEP